MAMMPGIQLSCFHQHIADVLRHLDRVLLFKISDRFMLAVESRHEVITQTIGIRQVT